MKTPTFLLTALLLGACSGESTESGVAKVDIEDPSTVLDPDGDGEAVAAIEDDVASIEFEIADPLPEISFRIDGTEDAAVLDLVDALSVVVSSPRSGISASLVDDGELVPAPPAGAGEWSIELSDDRTRFTFSWYNETRAGLTMKKGEKYDVVFSLGDNCCVSSVPDTTQRVTAD